MEGVVPETVMEAVKRTSKNMEELKTQFNDFLPLCDPHLLSQLDPLQRAQSLLLLAKATTTLFALKLRCNGIDPDDHPVKSELDRLSLYQEKLDKCIDLNKAPLRPSTTLNYRAATRFIQHSLPDLTSEQKQSLKEISTGEGIKANYSEINIHKKRRCQPTEKTSVQTAAQEFLEKAARELLGDNKVRFKGPLLPQDSDEDDMHVG